MPPNAAVVTHRDPDVDVGEVRPQQRRHERRRQDQQPAHRRRAGLGAMRLRPFLPDHLPDLEIAQPADQPRSHDQADDERRHARRRGAERDVAGHVEDRDLRVEREEEVVQHQPNTAVMRSTTRSVRVPRDPLTSTTSPDVSCAAIAGAASVLLSKCVTAASRHARVDRRLTERARRIAADREELRQPARRGQPAAFTVQRLGQLAELEHLANDRDAPARPTRARPRRAIAPAPTGSNCRNRR